MGAEDAAVGEQPQRLAVMRIDLDRLFQQRLRHRVVRPRHPPVMRERAHHEIPGVEAARRLVLRAKAFGGIEMRLDRGDDRLGDLVLHGEDVRDAAVVALGPQMAAGGDVVELRGDAHLVAAAAHAAFDDVAHAELARDLVDVGRAPLVDKG